MAYSPDLHHRQSHRLVGFNYQSSGAYFITICTQNRSPIFGDIKCGEMHLNQSGKIIRQLWNELPMFYPNIEIDEFVVMPDHIHGIIIVGAVPCGRPGFTLGQPQGVTPTRAPLSLPEIVHRFKSLSTRRFAISIKNAESPCFPGRLWQRNYWERIIRNENEWQALRNYIRCNPEQ